MTKVEEFSAVVLAGRRFYYWAYKAVAVYQHLAADGQLADNRRSSLKKVVPR